MKIKKINQNLIALLLLLPGIDQARSQDVEQIVIGTKHTLRSRILNEDRTYYVSLPDSYNTRESSHRNYPLLILLDGNIHFRNISGMVNYMSSDRYRSWKIPEMIVVGIQNVDRRRDYTPDKIITARKNNSGGGEKFLGFLENELIPELDRNYRSSPYRILFGHSLGGLLATHAYLKETSPFKAFISVDPSFGTWDAATMDQKLDKVTEQSFKRYFYIATANWGKGNIRNRDRHVRFFEALNARCDGVFPAKLEYFENENHSSVPPIAFYRGISTLFEGYGISYREVKSKEDLIQNFESISKRLGWDVIPPEHLVTQIGYNMLENETEKTRALDFFKLNTENFPDSPGAFYHLGEAYEALGDKTKAIENYKISLGLNHDNESAKMKLKSLGINE